MMEAIQHNKAFAHSKKCCQLNVLPPLLCFVGRLFGSTVAHWPIGEFGASPSESSGVSRMCFWSCLNCTFHPSNHCAGFFSAIGCGAIAK